jgi:peptide/nickel transport system substrate-binding protein
MLVRYKGDSTEVVEPFLAESFEANEDNTLFTFTLPENVLFHDGTVCDAQAVKDSMIRFRRLEMGPYIVLQRFVDDPESQIEVVDARTVTFSMTRPQPLFLAAMASSYGPFVVSPAAWAENATEDDPWAHEFISFNAVGTGPYRLVENITTELVRFEKFDEYHRGWEGPHFSEVVMRVVNENSTRRQLLEEGTSDAITSLLTGEDVQALSENPNLNTMIYPTTRVNWAILNAIRLGVDARRGLSYAFPYDEVIEGSYSGMLERSGPIPSTVRGADPDVFLYPTDLDRAAELLTAGGFPAGSSFDMLVVSETVEDTITAQLFQASLAQIGIDLSITEIDLATYEEIIFGEAPAEEKETILGSWEWWPDYNDPHNQLAPNFLESAIGGGGSNGGAWVNERFEEIMAEAEVFEDEDQLLELMKEAQQILTELDPPAIYYGETLMYTILQNDIQGFVPNPLYLESYFFYDMYRVSE